MSRKMRKISFGKREEIVLKISEGSQEVEEIGDGRVPENLREGELFFLRRAVLHRSVVGTGDRL